MPGARPTVKPLSAGELYSASDEESQLEQYLQRQLEEDVARIFDESIYSDLEVVCGKLKILTHSCILKARTHKFYHKLEAILHLNIGRNTFDEIYSFISDVYTECNIQHQEKGILYYLNQNLKSQKSSFTEIKTKEPDSTQSQCPKPITTVKTKSKESEETDEFATPNSVTPGESFQKPLSSSPSTELTKEYYALVPIEGNLLDKELIEQDALSSAFKSFITLRGSLNENKIKQCVKPTSLHLNSSHISKINPHSIRCDNIAKETDFNKINNESNITKNSNVSSQIRKTNPTGELDKLQNQIPDKTQESVYSPDSLITDEPSSSSDYLSAAFNVSPGIVSSGCFSQINMSENTSRMDNLITISDSGVENTGMVESINSHKDFTLTDLSLTESTLHDLLGDETFNSHEGVSSPTEIKQLQKFKICSTSGATTSDAVHNERKNTKSSSVVDTSGTSSKEEKQRQNEEIVIMESSSLSSETGSWESVFPPKVPEKVMSHKCINSERHNSNVSQYECDKDKQNEIDPLCPSLVQKKLFKATSCFIDAASLADEGESLPTTSDSGSLVHHTEESLIMLSDVPMSTNSVVSIPNSVVHENRTLNAIDFKRNPWSESTDALEDHISPENISPILNISIPVRRTLKFDDSPNDCSEDNANEDSLEQIDKDDSIHKDGSPTIFDMTPVTEDSLCTNVFENAGVDQQMQSSVRLENNQSDLIVNDIRSKPVFMQMSTPNNSIISVRPLDFNDVSDGIDVSIIKQENENLKGLKSIEEYNKFRKRNSDSPIISGGVSVEDHLPQASISGSPMSKRKIENTPIVSGAYIPEEKKYEKPIKPISNASAWVVDMSHDTKIVNDIKGHKKPAEKCLKTPLQSLSSENCKSRSSVDSDSSEKSQKFFIDLSTLPDAKPPDQSQDNNEKKNIFSIFIDLGDKSTGVKEMPARLPFTSTLKNKPDPKTPVNKCAKLLRLPLGDIKSNDDSQIIFEKLESLCNDPNINILEIIKDPAAPSKLTNKHDTEDVEDNIRIMQNEIVKNVIQEEEPEKNDLFVKLSDLDKPVQKQDNVSETVKTQSFERMTRSIPENNWPELESSHASNSRSIDIISSFHSENALSLNRLFPNLRNEFSRSMPGSLSSRTRSPFRHGVSSSPGDIDEQRSDASEISSVQSSMCRSVVENSTTEESSQTASRISNCQSRLGRDLLRMFLEEIQTDVIVEVSGRRIKAHKCILASRCQYFAGILSGGWVESAGDVIALPPFSFGVVHFALCHIYSGLSMIPDSISIVELATIADMLGLEGLKEAIMFTLKAKYCHHFHKPCPVCTAGVLECFPLSSVYGLDDLYRKCLRWITNYFHKVWPTKAFATLPSELLDKCYQEHIINLTTENIVETVYGCGITMSTLQNSRWAETVSRLCRRVLNAVAQFAAPRLVATLRSMAVLPADAPTPARQTLDDCITAAIEWAPPDEACRAYAYLSHLVRDMRAQHHSKPDLISTRLENVNLLQAHAAGWRLQCEGALVRAAPRVVATQAFKDLPADLRKRLAELGCIVYGGHAISNASPLQHRKTRASSRSSSNRSGNARSVDIDRVRASFVPYAPKPQPQPPAVSLEGSVVPIDRLGKSKTKSTPVVRSTKAQEERAKYNMTKSVPAVERVGTKNRVSYENTKPRYLEPKARKDRNPSVGCGGRKPVPKLVSSSESSRNSSPVIGRAGRTQRRAPAAATTASIARTADPSTDSLTDSHDANKYATYTKNKRNNVNGSLESMQSSNYQNQTAASNPNNKVKKTKIPVYLNQNTKTSAPVSNSNNIKKPVQPSEKVITENGSPLMQVRSRGGNVDRKISGSLMNATKSSSAKMVPKIVREQYNHKIAKQDKQSGKNSSKQPAPPVNETPIMERSGTFLKDEPTFGDRTTNMDIDE